VDVLVLVLVLVGGLAETTDESRDRSFRDFLG
jgi:hypothetical protein